MVLKRQNNIVVDQLTKIFYNGNLRDCNMAVGEEKIEAAVNVLEDNM